MILSLRLWPRSVHRAAFGYFLPGIITWNVGVAVILYATYLLACSRARSQPRYQIAMIIAILSAVVLDVKGETPTTSDYHWLRHHFEPEKRILRHASMLIFLLVSVFVVLHSARVAHQTRSLARIRDLLDASKWRKPADLIHDPSLQYFAFPLIAILLLVRSGFLAGSTSTSSFQKEKWTHDGLPFYFFGALPELFATLLFAIPGVITGPEDRDVLPTSVEAGHLLERYEAVPSDATTHSESRPSTPRERVD